MIAIRHLAKTFDGVRALDDVTLDLRQGATLAVTGPSGGGKTTLLRLVAGLDTPDEGDISIDGRIVSTPTMVEAPHERHVAMVFQASALWPHMTLAGNVRFAVRGLSRAEADERVRYLMERTELGASARRYPHQVSGGQARRAALARALASGSRYLLMDEPMINLDPALKARMIALVKEWTETTGAGLLFVTHDEAEARAVSDRRVVLAAGRVSA